MSFIEFLYRYFDWYIAVGFCISSAVFIGVSDTGLFKNYKSVHIIWAYFLIILFWPIFIAFLLMGKYK